ncbi:hypothetical protein C1646_757762 [Rhizophagus diaphanus]|nr:hypothetical protein C1646_757762 [Rhizophagus diaphanus] [Rhizophagus sp. MUCL 43196]
MDELYAWDHQNLRYGTAATFILGANSSKEPDSWLNLLIPVEIISFGTASLKRTTLNYITKTTSVPLNNIIGVGLTDPITGNNYSACNMAGIGTYIVNIQGTELFDGDPTLHPLTAAMTHGFDLNFRMQYEMDLEFKFHQ